MVGQHRAYIHRQQNTRLGNEPTQTGLLRCCYGDGEDVSNPRILALDILFLSFVLLSFCLVLTLQWWWWCCIQPILYTPLWMFTAQHVSRLSIIAAIESSKSKQKVIARSRIPLYLVITVLLTYTNNYIPAWLPPTRLSPPNRPPNPRPLALSAANLVSDEQIFVSLLVTIYYYLCYYQIRPTVYQFPRLALLSLAGDPRVCPFLLFSHHHHSFFLSSPLPMEGIHPASSLLCMRVSSPFRFCLSLFYSYLSF